MQFRSGDGRYQSAGKPVTPGQRPGWCPVSAGLRAGIARRSVPGHRPGSGQDVMPAGPPGEGAARGRCSAPAAGTRASRRTHRPQPGPASARTSPACPAPRARSSGAARSSSPVIAVPSLIRVELVPGHRMFSCRMRAHPSTQCARGSLVGGSRSGLTRLLHGPLGAGACPPRAGIGSVVALRHVLPVHLRSRIATSYIRLI